MKSKQILKFSASLLLISGAAFSLNAQPIELVFNVPGDDGFVNNFPVTASGTVTLDGADVTLELTNGAYPSMITKVWLLKPLTLGLAVDASTLDTPGAPWTLSNSLNEPNTGGNPANILSGTIGLTENDYFGAYSTSQAGALAENTTLSYSWTMNGVDELLDWSRLENPNVGPGIVIRWQTIGDDGEGSAAGYTWLYTDFPTTPVPEPRLIAPLAVLGLGGLLYARRRIKAKKTAKS